MLIPTTIYGFATTCAFSSILLSSVLVYFHLKNYRKPLEQRLVVRILLLLPFYAFISWLGLLEATITTPSFFLHILSSILTPLEEAYEALVIYTFFSLLTQYLGGERNLVLNALGRAPKPHPGVLGPYLPLIDISDPHTFLMIKRGILQYVWIKPLLSVFIMITKFTHTYRDGTIALNSGYAWIGAVYNLSVSTSLYSLALFWYTLHEDLRPFKPMPKFMCIKLVIFFSYWQGVILAIAGWFHLIPSSAEPVARNGSIAAAIQNTLMCIEMVGFSIGHWYAFSYREFSEGILISTVQQEICVSYILTQVHDPDVVPATDAMQLARMPLPYAIRDVLGGLDLLMDFRETFTGRDYTFRNFDVSASTILEHPLAKKARDRRLREGLRYVQGGKAKYWLPEAGQLKASAALITQSGGIQGYGSTASASNSNSGSTVYENSVGGDSSELSDTDSTTSNNSEFFMSPDEMDQDDLLYSQARKLTYGDYNVSKHSYLLRELFCLTGRLNYDVTFTNCFFLPKSFFMIVPCKNFY